MQAARTLSPIPGTRSVTSPSLSPAPAPAPAPDAGPIRRTRRPSHSARWQLLTSLIGLVLLALPGAAAAEELRRTITVQGQGVVSAQPDTARISAGVTSQAATARAAMTENTRRMTAVMEAVTDAGVARADVRTSGLSLSPIYSQPERRPDGTRPTPEIVAYRASNQVSVTVRDLEKLGALLDAVVTAGATNLGNIAFVIDKADTLMDEARRRAVEDALRRASVMAGAARANLGRVITISENAAPMPQPMMMRMATAEAGGGRDVPVAPGTQELRATAHLVIELE